MAPETFNTAYHHPENNFFKKVKLRNVITMPLTTFVFNRQYILKDTAI